MRRNSSLPGEYLRDAFRSRILASSAVVNNCNCRMKAIVPHRHSSRRPDRVVDHTIFETLSSLLTARQFPVVLAILTGHLPTRQRQDRSAHLTHPVHGGGASSTRWPLRAPSGVVVAVPVRGATSEPAQPRRRRICRGLAVVSGRSAGRGAGRSRRPTRQYG
jgi:hypothetical protein